VRARPRDFAGALALDKWTCNANGRQVAFWKKGRERKFTASFIDQGYCFNAGEWTFPDFPLRGVYPRNEVYARVNGWESFEPWLSRIEKLDEPMVAPYQTRIDRVHRQPRARSVAHAGSWRWRIFTWALISPCNPAIEIQFNLCARSDARCSSCSVPTVTCLRTLSIEIT